MVATMTTTTSEPGYADLPRLISLMTGDDKHHAAAESTVDVLWVLFDRVLDLGPDTARNPGRDRFLLSKGHGPMAYYAVLVAKGWLDEDELAGFGVRRGRGSATIRTASAHPASKSPAARSGTACRSPSAPPSACAPAGSARGSSRWSATPNSTRAPTTRRSPSPLASGSTS